MGNTCCAQRGGSLDRQRLKPPKHENENLFDSNEAKLNSKDSTDKWSRSYVNLDDDQKSENMFQINTYHNNDPTQVVEELRILWSRKQNLQDKALELQFPENSRKQKGTKNKTKKGLTTKKGGVVGGKDTPSREVTPTTYISKNNIMKSFENLTENSVQKQATLNYQSGMPMPFNQDLYDLEIKNNRPIKQSASWGHNLGTSQQINYQNNDYKQQTANVHQLKEETMNFSQISFRCRCKSEDLKHRLVKDQESQDLIQFVQNFLKLTKREKVAKQRQAINIQKWNSNRNQKNHKHNQYEVDMEFVSPNEEEAFNVNIINKKKSPTPAAMKSKKKQ